MGTLHVLDEAGVLRNITGLQSAVHSLPFDVTVLTKTTVPKLSSFQSLTESYVTKKGIVIGLDPVHRHVAVYYGVDLHVSSNDYRTIRESGSSAFKRADYAEGMRDIALTASKYVNIAVEEPPVAIASPPAPVPLQHTAVPPAPAPQATKHEGCSGAGVGVVCVLALFGIGTWILIRSRRMMDAAMRKPLPRDDTLLSPVRPTFSASTGTGPSPFERAGVEPTFVQQATGTPPKPAGVSTGAAVGIGLGSAALGYEFGKHQAEQRRKREPIVADNSYDAPSVFDSYDDPPRPAPARTPSPPPVRRSTWTPSSGPSSPASGGGDGGSYTPDTSSYSGGGDGGSFGGCDSGGGDGGSY